MSLSRFLSHVKASVGIKFETSVTFLCMLIFCFQFSKFLTPPPKVENGLVPPYAIYTGVFSVSGEDPVNQQTKHGPCCEDTVHAYNLT